MPLQDWLIIVTSPFQEETQDDHESNDNYLSVEVVKKAMKKLPEGALTISSLYLLEGYNHVEISQILNISESWNNKRHSWENRIFKGEN